MILIYDRKYDIEFNIDGSPFLGNLPAISIDDVTIKIAWHFNMKEYSHIISILMYYSITKACYQEIDFYCWYIPYNTFGSNLIKILGNYVDNLFTEAQLSYRIEGWAIEHYIDFYNSVTVESIWSALKESNSSCILFLDRQEYNTYSSYLRNKMNDNNSLYLDVPFLHLDELQWMAFYDWLEENYKDKNILIVQNNCLFGYNYVDTVAQDFKDFSGIKNVYFYTSHCSNEIFEDSLLEAESHIDGIYTTNSIEHDAEKMKNYSVPFHEYFLLTEFSDCDLQEFTF